MATRGHEVFETNSDVNRNGKRLKIKTSGLHCNSRALMLDECEVVHSYEITPNFLLPTLKASSLVLHTTSLERKSVEFSM